MKKLIILLLFFSSMSSNAALMFENALDASSDDAGGFSHINQVLAGEFSLGVSGNIDRATWNGTMFSADPLDTGDEWTFDLVFRNAINGMPGDIISSSSVVATVTDTGEDIQFERSYLFDASFSEIFFDMGSSYFISVINTGDQNTFRWNLAQDDLYAGYKLNNASSEWSDLASRSPLNFSLYNTRIGVPEPTSGVLFGLGLLAMYLSRKNRY